MTRSDCSGTRCRAEPGVSTGRPAR
jgi:hypothetical protein